VRASSSSKRRNGQTAAGNAAAFKSAWFRQQCSSQSCRLAAIARWYRPEHRRRCTKSLQWCGVLQANVVFGANVGSLGSPPTLLQTFDNAAGLNNTTITQSARLGQNSAFGRQPWRRDGNRFAGEITPVNDSLSRATIACRSIAEDSGDRTISFASLLGNDPGGPPLKAIRRSRSLTPTTRWRNGRHRGDQCDLHAGGQFQRSASFRLHGAGQRHQLGRQSFPNGCGVGRVHDHIRERSAGNYVTGIPSSFAENHCSCRQRRGE
jgi:hypothetical protein